MEIANILNVISNIFATLIFDYAVYKHKFKNGT